MTRIPAQRAVSNTPVDRTGAWVDCFPVRTAFPGQETGRPLHRLFRGLLELHSRSGPLDRATVPRPPLAACVPRRRPARLLSAEPLVRFRINRHRSGWTLPPFIALDEAPVEAHF